MIILLGTTFRHDLELTCDKQRYGSNYSIREISLTFRDLKVAILGAIPGNLE